MRETITLFAPNGTFTTQQIIVPAFVDRVRFRGVAWGGSGNAANGNIPGGGGGAGAYIDEELILEPLSLIWYYVSSNYVLIEYRLKNSADYSKIRLWHGGLGQAGGATVPGAGGASGNGNDGGGVGTAFNFTFYPRGNIDLNGNAHSTGGWGGMTTVTSPRVYMDFARNTPQNTDASLVTTGYQNNYFPFKWSNNIVPQTNAGGVGGCSYYGHGGSYTTDSLYVKPGYGGGSAGQSRSVDPLPVNGGDSFLELSWDGLTSERRV